MINPTNPLDLLKSDHEKIKSMLDDYKGMDFNNKSDKINEIAENLAIHMEMEESLFYPRVQKISDIASESIEEAIDEHSEARDHLSELMAAPDEMEMDNHAAMLEAGIMEHIEREENEIFNYAETG